MRTEEDIRERITWCQTQVCILDDLAAKACDKEEYWRYKEDAYIYQRIERVLRWTLGREEEI